MNHIELLEVASTVKQLQKNLYKKISKKTGVHHTALEIILFLNDNKERNSAKDICDLLNLKANLVSFHIFKLVKDGYIIRESIDGDRRKVKLVLTEKCDLIINRGNLIKKEIYNNIMTECNEEELNTVSEFLWKLKKIIINIKY